ncbi:MAG: hypothetical protein ACJ768_04210 [Gaiellaceae bacterium]
MVVAAGYFPALAAALPDGRRYELVSPPDKRGGDVIASSQRARAASGGQALGFASLTAFGDTVGTGSSTDYMAVRSTAASPGTNGWTTHSLTPLQQGVPLGALVVNYDPMYVRDFSDDGRRGVFWSLTPLTDDFGVGSVGNLYRRTNLDTPGAGTYEVITRCPLCETSGVPLPPLPAKNVVASTWKPLLAGASPDFEHIVFESRLNLTEDAPAQPTGPAGCVMTDPTLMDQCRTHLYEWDAGTVRLAGILPDGTAADVSIAGQGAGASRPATLTPHTVSDGSDGHVRVFFTQPTDAAGRTSSEVNGGEQTRVNQAGSGDLYMRVDGAFTEQLNVSERSSADAFSPATYLDASVDGSRVFFMTAQALTGDAPAGGGRKLYMYDASQPGAAPNNLTLIAAGGAAGMVGASADGRYAYFVLTGLDGPRLFLWHEGSLTEIGAASGTDDVFNSGVSWQLGPRQARVTSEGRHLLFSAYEGGGLTGYDHGDCRFGTGGRCRELYLFSADSDQLVCVSCNPSRAAATAMASSAVVTNLGGSRTTAHDNRALTDDGSRVFFSTAEALLSEDVNGRDDAYEYDVESGALALLSSGTSPSDSWFLDASSDGDDAFILTRERLVGWDVDGAYDVYDTRVGGGFPEPAPAPPTCEGEACRALPQPGLGAYAAGGSSVFEGAGDVTASVRHRAKRCKRGFVRRTVRGRRRCVKRSPRHRRSHAKARRNVRLNRGNGQGR